MKFAVLLWAISCITVSAHAGDADWPSYGGDYAKTRHSALRQINRQNVAGLDQIGRASCRERV